MTFKFNKILAFYNYQNKMKDYYQILEIPRYASKNQIDNAYKRLALIWHPSKYHIDKNYAEQRFHDISEAYDVLSDFDKRKHYDFFFKPDLSLQEAQKNFSNKFPSVKITPVKTTEIKKPVTSDIIKKDYYSILGVSRFASEREIEEAYQRLSQKYHPHYNIENADAHIKFMEIDQAYHALKHDMRRKTYDRWFYNEFQPAKSELIFKDFFKDRDFPELDHFKSKFTQDDYKKPLMPLSNTKNTTDSYKTETYYTKKNGQQTKKTVTVKKQIHDGKVYEKRKEETSFPDGNREIIETINQNGHITTNKLELLPGQYLPKQLMY